MVQSFEVGLGNLNQEMGKIQTNDQGDTTYWSWDLALSLGTEIEFNSLFGLGLEALTTFPKKGRDSHIKSSTSKFLLPFIWRPMAKNPKSWQLRLGPGLAFRRIQGPGGTQALGNGPEDTQNFPLPKNSVVSSNLIWELGSDLRLPLTIQDRPWAFGVRLQIFAYDLFRSDTRHFNQSLMLHWIISHAH